MKEKCKENYRGKIKKINHIVISDPGYGNDVCCRYERKNLYEKDWTVDIRLTNVSEKYMGMHINGISFLVLFKANNQDYITSKDGLDCVNDLLLNRINIVIDSACVAFGINEYAEEIKKSINNWQPECSLKTNCDGIFGEVIEGVKDNKVVFIGFDGFLGDDSGYNKEDILDYISTHFKISDLKIQKKKKEKDLCR